MPFEMNPRAKFQYDLIRAARYLGVKPWELAQQPVSVMWNALEFERIEREAEKIRDEGNGAAD